MNYQLECALLIDDDPSFNYLHHRLLKKKACFNQVEIAESAEQGLEILRDRAAAGAKHPELILLDINMPGMSGWEFMDLVKQEAHFDSLQTHVFILTSSVHPDDQSRAEARTDVDGLIEKLLTEEKLDQLLRQYF